MSRTERSRWMLKHYFRHEKPEARRQHMRAYRKRANQMIAKGYEPPKWQKTQGWLTW